MPSYLVDSSVLLDVFTADQEWLEWSVEQLEKAAREGSVFIDSIVYAEVSIRFSRIEDLQDAVQECGLIWSEIPREALFLAGKAWMTYRKRGGERPTPLPDFFIGAHAAVSDMVLITRDAGRVRSYFPSVAIVHPKAS